LFLFFCFVFFCFLGFFVFLFCCSWPCDRPSDENMQSAWYGCPGKIQHILVILVVSLVINRSCVCLFLAFFKALNIQVLGNEDSPFPRNHYMLNGR
jgi:hypothetical protein